MMVAVLLSVLRQLRAGYTHRLGRFPHQPSTLSIEANSS